MTGTQLQLSALALLAALSSACVGHTTADGGDPNSQTLAAVGLSSAAPIGSLNAQSVWRLGDTTGDGSDAIALTGAITWDAGPRTSCSLALGLRVPNGGFAVALDGPYCGVGDVSEVWADDMNGDGLLDLVTLITDPIVGVLGYYGLGNGQFGYGTCDDAGVCTGGNDNGFSIVYPLGALGTPLWGVSGDFDGAGTHDIALDVRLDAGEALAFLWNPGPSGVTQGPLVSVDSCPPRDHFLAVADFNGDGLSDVARLDCSGDFEIFFGGNVVNPSRVLVAGAAPGGSIAVGSLFGDAGADVVIGMANRLQLYRGLGNGGFAPAVSLSGCPSSTLASPDAPYGSLAIGDWNGDGLADVAASKSGEDIEFFMAQADGGFECRSFLGDYSTLVPVYAAHAEAPDLLAVDNQRITVDLFQAESH
jgi:hypothetical protein